MGTKTKRKSKGKNRRKKKIEAKYKWIKYIKIALIIFLAVTMVRFGILMVKTSKMPETPKDKISYPVRGVDGAEEVLVPEREFDKIGRAHV